jgi:hypothetical protein
MVLSIDTRRFVISYVSASPANGIELDAGHRPAVIALPD